jgi:molybdopterin synthase catalytic subunit
MFKLTSQPIDVDALHRDLIAPDIGAAVEFSGTVRNRNRGRAVIALEYEGADALARVEFEAIEREARASFAVARIDCVHRVGRLQPGDTAVWIGVTSTHREAAFAACEFVINQVKQRLPIWKKEHYADGQSEWIGSP